MPHGSTAEGDLQAGERVAFDSDGGTIVGWLFAAAFNHGPAPAVVITGPEPPAGNHQKEQAPMQPAPRLAKLGFTALVFDPHRPRRQRRPATLLRLTRPPS